MVGPKVIVDEHAVKLGFSVMEDQPAEIQPAGLLSAWRRSLTTRTRVPSQYVSLTPALRLYPIALSSM